MVSAVDPALKTLAGLVADWVDDVPYLRRVYLFGSRVRGDHRPDSDVDIGIDLTDLDVTNSETVDWWIEQNQTNFQTLRSAIPYPVGISRSDYNGADWPSIRAGKTVHRDRKCVCVWTPPRG